MTHQEVIAGIDRRIEALQAGVAMQRAVRSVMAAQTVRIFEKGQNSAGAAIGSYNNRDEMWVNPDTLPRNVSPRGKPGNTRKVKGQRKTAYFTSYQALRQEVGRESGFINLRLTNDLQSDFANAQISGDGVISNPEPKKISTLEYHVTLKRDVNIKKRRGLEKRFGPIFNLTSGEKRFYLDVLRKEILLLDA